MPIQLHFDVEKAWEFFARLYLVQPQSGWEETGTSLSQPLRTDCLTCAGELAHRVLCFLLIPLPKKPYTSSHFLQAKDFTAQKGPQAHVWMQHFYLNSFIHFKPFTFPTIQVTRTWWITIHSVGRTGFTFSTTATRACQRTAIGCWAVLMAEVSVPVISDTTESAAPDSRRITTDCTCPGAAGESLPQISPACLKLEWADSFSMISSTT